MFVAPVEATAARSGLISIVAPAESMSGDTLME